ncbi:C40 family peptidase [Naasia sp. SYSU D00057]|uniref:C40 family peptidase n=1 Tax=Naasia sp. SYSU D00057 TaxID=2817380 RepID=UPI001B300562|nr:C40 family peptidase [Naasia sp. SYSU D00057]
MTVPASVQAVQSRIAEIVSLVEGSGARASTATAPAAFADALQAAAGADPSSALLGDGTVTGEDVAAAAQKYVGVPYVFGGTTSSGMDCSGLVQTVFKDLGIDVPRLVRDQEDIGTEVPSLAEAKPGDLIVLEGGDHIAIYLGNNTVIHAPYAGRDVSVQKLWVGEEGITTIRRVVPETAARTPDLASLLGGSASTSSLDSLSALLGGGTSVNSSTAQQLMAARSALLSGSLS